MQLKLKDVCLLNKYPQLDASSLEELKSPCGEIKLLPSSKDYDWVSTLEKTKQYLCKGEIVTLGKARYANIKYHKGLFVSANNILVESKDQNRVLTKYIYYYCLKNNKKFYVEGTTYPKFDLSSFNNAQINILPLEKQQIIISELDNLLSLISKNEKQLNLFDELIKSRFNEMFNGYKANKTIGEIASICRGASPRPISKFITNKDGENWIKIGDVGENDIYITHTAEKVTKEGANKSRRVKSGDFILSNSMSFGRPYILSINGCVHDGWLIISNYQSTFEPLFFYQLLRTDEVQAQFDGSANGACVRNLNSDLVKKVEVMTPPMNLQKEFVTFFNQIDKSKFVYHSKYFLCDSLTLTSSTIAYSSVVSILE